MKMSTGAVGIRTAEDGPLRTIIQNDISIDRLKTAYRHPIAIRTRQLFIVSGCPVRIFRQQDLSPAAGLGGEGHLLRPADQKGVQSLGQAQAGQLDIGFLDGRPTSLSEKAQAA